MEKRFDFEVVDTLTIKNELTKGFLLDINALNAAGDTICNIANLNNIGIDITYKVKGREDHQVFSGYLEDLLVGLFAQTTRMVIAKKKLSSGYKVQLDFGAIFYTDENRTLEIRIDAKTSAFTSCSKLTSSILVESIPAIGTPTMIPQVKVHGIASGETSFEKMIGNDISKITFANDNSNSYDTTTKPKVVSMTMNTLTQSGQTLSKDASENMLIAENMNYLDVNPETDVQHLVLHNDRLLLDAVKLKLKLSKAADSDTRVISLGFYNI